MVSDGETNKFTQTDQHAPRTKEVYLPHNCDTILPFIPYNVRMRSIYFPHYHNFGVLHHRFAFCVIYTNNSSLFSHCGNSILPHYILHDLCSFPHCLTIRFLISVPHRIPDQQCLPFPPCLALGCRTTHVASTGI